MMNTSEQIFFTANYTMYKIYMYIKKKTIIIILRRLECIEIIEIKYFAYLLCRLIKIFTQ